MLIKTYTPNNIYMNIHTYSGSMLPMHVLLKKKEKNSVELNNQLVSGFTFYFSGECSYIIDPRGFAVNVSKFNLNKILKESTVINGELIGEYKWCFEDGQITIIRKDIIDSRGLISEDELKEKKITSGIKGNVYSMGDTKKYTYIGRYFNIKFRIDKSVKSSTGSMLCSVDDLIQNSIVLNEKNYVSFRSKNSGNVYPEHVFIDERGRMVFHRSFTCYEDCGPGKLSSDDIRNMMCELSDWGSYCNISYLVELTSEYYSKPISNSVGFIELGKEYIENIKSRSKHFYIKCPSAATPRLTVFTNMDMESVANTNVTNRYESPSKIYSDHPSTKMVEIPALSYTLKNKKEVYFTPFGIM